LVQQIVGRERRERVSQLAWCGGGCFDSRRRVNSTVRRLTNSMLGPLTLRHLILLLVVATSALPVVAQSQDTVKAILLERTVELVPKRESDAADFTTVNVIVDGK